MARPRRPPRPCIRHFRARPTTCLILASVERASPPTRATTRRFRLSLCAPAPLSFEVAEGVRNVGLVLQTKSHRRDSASFLLRVAPVFEGGKEDSCMFETQDRARGSTASAISNGAVRILHEYTGRGPTKARTTINTNSVMILFGDTLTKGERKLAESGNRSAVL